MIQERARVLRVEGDTAWLRCESQAGCQRCAEGRGCGGGLFSRLLRGRLQEIPVEITEPVKTDDWVMLGLDPAAVQNAALLMYGLPLFLLLLGAALGDALNGDAGAIVAALAGLGGGFWLARWLVHRREGQGTGFQPVMLRRLSPGEPCPATCPEPRED